MAMTRDLVMRLVKQLGEALARIAGLRRAGKLDDALQALGDTQRELLGEADALVGRVDAETAAHLLGHKQNVLIYAELLAERAEILAAMNQADIARRTFQRALLVCLEAEAVGGRLDERTRPIVERVQSRVDVVELSERHRAILARF